MESGKNLNTDSNLGGLFQNQESELVSLTSSNTVQRTLPSLTWYLRLMLKSISILPLSLTQTTTKFSIKPKSMLTTQAYLRGLKRKWLFERSLQRLCSKLKLQSRVKLSTKGTYLMSQPIGRTCWPMQPPLSTGPQRAISEQDSSQAIWQVKTLLTSAASSTHRTKM